MTQLSLLQQAQIMLNQARAAGQIPIHFAMNEATRRTVAQLVATSCSERRSLLKQLSAYLKPKESQGSLSELHGMPVKIDNDLPDGIIGLQVAVRAMQNPQNRQTMPEFTRKEPVRGEYGKPTLDDLANSGDRVSPSDVLMKSFESVDRVKQIVVIRVYDNGDIDMALNANHFEATEILQKAMYYLATRG